MLNIDVFIVVLMYFGWGLVVRAVFVCPVSKLYVDKFVAQVSKMLYPGVVYRQIVLTMPKQLRQPFYSVRHNDELLSRLMKIGHQCLEEVVSVALRKNVKIMISGRYRRCWDTVMLERQGSIPTR